MKIFFPIGFVQYKPTFVQQDADDFAKMNFAAATSVRHRAPRLEVTHAGFRLQLRADPRRALRAAIPSDVPLLDWTAAA